MQMSSDGEVGKKKLKQGERDEVKEVRMTK